MKIQIALLAPLILGTSSASRFLDEIESCEPDCFCIRDDESDTCPNIKQRIEPGSEEAEIAAAFFASLTPDDGALATLEPAGCQPYPLVAAALGKETCTGVNFTSKPGKIAEKRCEPVDPDDEDVVCAFNFPKKICDKKTYALQEFGGACKKLKFIKKGGVTHEGPCGLCSGAQDLATNLKPTLGQEAAACTAIATILFNNPANLNFLIPSTQSCFEDIGFAKDCAFVWASNSVNLLFELELAGSDAPYAGPDSCVECADQCVGVFPPPQECLSLTLPGSCDLAPCTACDEEANGPLFKKYSGRTRRNSGILTAIKRPCGSTENIKQPYKECSAPVEEDDD